MNKGKGVKVLVKETKEYGFITRRLDAHNYEVWLESRDEIRYLSPEDFIEEKEKEEK